MDNFERVEVKLGGFGGQGIILAGYILGKAAALHDKRHATMMQSYGPESRGGACSSTVVITEKPGAYPAATHLHFFAAMSQEAAQTYRPQVQKDTVVLVDRDLVQWKDRPLPFRVPAVALAEGLGKKMVANIVMLGALARVMERAGRGVSRGALEEAVKTTVKKAFVELNLRALAQGYELEEPRESEAELLAAFSRGGTPG